MIFLRGRSSFGVEAGGLSGSWNIPLNIQAGDYCVVFSSNNGDASAVTKPAWLTQQKTLLLTDVCNLFIYSGFVPNNVSGTNLTISVSDRSPSDNKPWIWTASFWGGVHNSNPVVSEATNILDNVWPQTDTSVSASLLAFLAQDEFTSGTNNSNLSGLTPSSGIGGAWTTPTGTYASAGGDFLLNTGDGTTSPYGIIKNIRRSTLVDSAIELSGRWAYAPGTNISPGGTLDPNLLDQTVSVDYVNDISYAQAQQLVNFGGYGALRHGLVIRAKDKDNFVLLVHYYDQFQNWSGGGRFGYIDLWKFKGGVGTKIKTKFAGWQQVIYDQAELNQNWQTMKLSVNRKGEFSASYSQDRVNFSTLYTGQDDDLKEGGALGGVSNSAGYAGVYDCGWTPTSPPSYNLGTINRFYDNFKSLRSGEADLFVIGGFTANSDDLVFSTSPNGANAIADKKVPDYPDLLGRTITQKYLDGTVSLADPITMDLSIVPSSKSDNPTLRIFHIGLREATEEKIVNIRNHDSCHYPWKFWLADGQNPSEIIDDLSSARNKSISYVLNRSGSASFQLNIEEEVCRSIEPLSTALVATRGAHTMWSGPIWTVEESTDGAVNVTASGWQSLLDRRLIRPEHEHYSRFGKTEQGMIAAHLLAFAHETQLRPDINTGPIFLVDFAYKRQHRKRSYERYQSIGQELIALSDIENGFDIWFDPHTQKIQIWDELSEDLTGTCTFSYNVGGIHNLQSVSRQRAADRVVNGLYVTTKTPATTPPQQINQNSAQLYGFLEEQVSLSEATDANTALGYAMAEFQFRSQPLPTYSITPLPHNEYNSVPGPLADYHIGSIVTFSANRGSIQVENQSARIFQIDIQIDDNGNETVSNLSIFHSA